MDKDHAQRHTSRRPTTRLRRVLVAFSILGALTAFLAPAASAQAVPETVDAVPVTTYSCPSGYGATGMGAATTCSRTVETNTTVAVVATVPPRECPAGALGSVPEVGPPSCHYETTTTTPPICGVGQTELPSGQCRVPVDDDEKCPASSTDTGFILNGSKLCISPPTSCAEGTYGDSVCTHTSQAFVEPIQPATMYECPPGSTGTPVAGGTCTVPGTATENVASIATTSLACEAGTYGTPTAEDPTCTVGFLCGGQVVTVDMSIGQSPTQGDDVIRGTAGNDVITSLGGADIICALQGDDIIDAGDGFDKVFAGAGRDQVDGGSGNDLLIGGPDGDTLNGGNGNDRIQGGDGVDTLNGENGKDRIAGGNGNDLLIGGRHDDTLFGNLGRDELFGGEGNDVLRGGAWQDLMDGGTQNDGCTLSDPGGLTETRISCETGVFGL